MLPLALTLMISTWVQLETKEQDFILKKEQLKRESRLHWKDGIFKQPYGKKGNLICNNFDAKDFHIQREFNSYRYKWATGNAYCLKDKSGKNLLIGTRANTFGVPLLKDLEPPTKLTVKYVGMSPNQSVSVRLKVGNQWLGSDGGFYTQPSRQ